MGIYDREYYQADEPRGFYWVGQRAMVTNLIIINIVLYVLNLLFTGESNAITDFLALKPGLFAAPENLLNAWQLVTYGFVHAPITSRVGILHILMNMYGLYLFGRDMEARYGRMEFLRLYLVLIVFGGLVWSVHQLFVPSSGGVVGASGAVVGIMVLYCSNFPRRTLYLLGLLPVPAWLLAVGFVGLDIMRALSAESTVAFDVHLAGAAFAFAYFRFHWNLGRVVPSRLPRIRRWFRAKPNLKVHHPEDYYRNLDEQADRLLEKVHREGATSLTSEERRLLEDYSRRMRQKHR